MSTLGPAVVYTDRSGTITSGGVAQQLAPSNGIRGGFLIQNLSTGDLYIRTGGTASAAQPSIWLPAGAYYEMPDIGISSETISIYGATTGQAFTAKEW